MQVSPVKAGGLKPVPNASSPNHTARLDSDPSSQTQAVELADEVADRVAERLLGVLSPPSLLDISGVADRLNVSRRTVENLVALGEIPVIRIGGGRGVRRFEQAALDAFVRRSTRSVG